MSRRGVWPWARLIIITCVFWVTFEKLGLFGLSEAANRYVGSLIELVDSPFHAARSRGQDHIVVVLIDDRFVTAIGGEWPPGNAIYQALFDEILRPENRPRGLFVDLLLRDLRDGDHTVLTQTLQQLGPKVYAPVLTCDGTLPALYGPAATKVMVSFSESRDGYALTPCAASANAPQPLSPALAIYAKDCKHCVRPGLFDRTMDVRWGRRLDLAEPGQQGAWREALRLFCVAMLDAQSDSMAGRTGAAGPCGPRYQQRPFIRTIPALDLISGAAREGAGALHPLLKNKIVMVGLKIDGLPDHIDSPIDGLTPGVYHHAMALDNLMTFGAGYYGDSPNPSVALAWWFGNEDRRSFSILIALVLLVAVLRRVPVDSLFSAHTRQWLCRAAAIGSGALVVVVTAAALLVFDVGLAWGTLACLCMGLALTAEIRRFKAVLPIPPGVAVIQRCHPGDNLPGLMSAIWRHFVQLAVILVVFTGFGVLMADGLRLSAMDTASLALIFDLVLEIDSHNDAQSRPA